MPTPSARNSGAASNTRMRRAALGGVQGQRKREPADPAADDDDVHEEIASVPRSRLGVLIAAFGYHSVPPDRRRQTTCRTRIATTAAENTIVASTSAHSSAIAGRQDR